MKQAMYYTVALMITLATTGPIHADTLDPVELCGEFEILNDPDTRIYQGESEHRGTTHATGLVMTPISNSGATMVFYMWGAQPKWKVDEPGCVPATGYWKKNVMTVYMNRGKIRVAYKFSDDEMDADYTFKRGSRSTKGSVSLSEM